LNQPNYFDRSREHIPRIISGARITTHAKWLTRRPSRDEIYVVFERCPIDVANVTLMHIPVLYQIKA
jgi:hypothetical protein